METFGYSAMWRGKWKFFNRGFVFRITMKIKAGKCITRMAIQFIIAKTKDGNGAKFIARFLVFIFQIILQVGNA